jgi:hypothetical protein
MNESFKIVPLIRGLCGATIGGLIGYYVFDWILDQRFYAMVLPGACLGMGFGLASRERSTVCGIVSGLLGLAFGLFMEWQFFPFKKDGSLEYFLQNIHQLKPITLMMIGLGGLIAFWFGVGRESVVKSKPNDSSSEEEG